MQSFRRVMRYVYSCLLSRYAFGVIVCCLALTTVVLTLVGMILGVAGWRKDRSPDSRTRLSHCGGIVLLMWVANYQISRFHWRVFASSLMSSVCLSCLFNAPSPCLSILPSLSLPLPPSLSPSPFSLTPSRQYSDVGLTFFFAFVLLILASLAFFFGSNIQKICQAIEPPEYELYTRVRLSSI